MIAISARIDMDPADAERFLEAATPVVANTRVERGCTLYAITRDIVESHIFWISEEWDTDEDLYAHLRSAHIAEFLGRAAAMNMRSMDVRKYEVSSVGPLELPQD